jgi:SAM-dependent methyltransferase
MASQLGKYFAELVHRRRQGTSLAATGDAREFITTLYQVFLSRDPDESGLFANLTELENGVPRAQIVRQLLQSAEFQATLGQHVALYSLPSATPMRVDLSAAAEQENALWEHVAASWVDLGEHDPYRSVLNSPQWAADRMSAKRDVDAFYDTGKHDGDRLLNWITRNKLNVSNTATCAEYGCGVGRNTMWLARHFGRVIAFDISKPHLELASARAKVEGLSNIEFVHVRQASDLQRLEDIDLFYSIIVLQHNPPPIILAILKSAFEGLRPGGIAYFQVPTYSRDYAFDLQAYLGVTELSMEMHFVPQRSIFELAHQHSMQPVEVTPDDMIGNADRWISTSFLMTKPSATR